jgi:hypothetical protein
MNPTFFLLFCRQVAFSAINGKNNCPQEIADEIMSKDHVLWFLWRKKKLK